MVLFVINIFMSQTMSLTFPTRKKAKHGVIVHLPFQEAITLGHYNAYNPSFFQMVYPNLTLWKIAIWLSKNCQKLDIFFKKIDKKCHFFNKIAIGNFVEKNDTFCQFFWKKCQSFGNFLTFKWQFWRGSDTNPVEVRQSEDVNGESVLGLEGEVGLIPLLLAPVSTLLGVPDWILTVKPGVEVERYVTVVVGVISTLNKPDILCENKTFHDNIFLIK